MFIFILIINLSLLPYFILFYSIFFSLSLFSLLFLFLLSNFLSYLYFLSIHSCISFQFLPLFPFPLLIHSPHYSFYTNSSLPYSHYHPILLLISPIITFFIISLILVVPSNRYIPLSPTFITFPLSPLRRIISQKEGHWIEFIIIIIY